MERPYVCVAGVDAESNEHLRPILSGGRRLTRSLLAEAGGPFELGAVVELGEVTPRPSPPEIEDHLFEPRSARKIGAFESAEYWGLIDGLSVPSLSDAFGPALQRRRSKCAVDRGEGDGSLACVRLEQTPSLEVNRYDRPQLRFYEAGRRVEVAVTDLRFFEDDQNTPKLEAIDDVNRRLAEGVEARIMFGLARAWRARYDTAERHWLQANGVCLEDRPLGPKP